jgi:hypothetical protein
MKDPVIKVGDDKVTFNLRALANGNIIDLVDADIIVDFKTNGREFTKNATVTDEAGGICQVLLTSDDLSTAGNYWFQATITMKDGTGKYTSDPVNFPVDNKI